MLPDMVLTFIILLITTVLFVQGKYRPDFIAIGSLLALVITGVLSPTEALAGFSSPVVIMIAGLFIVGAGIFNTGLAKSIGNQLIKFGGGSEVKLLIIIMLTVGVLSAFMSNTGTVAMLLPVVISIAISMKVSPAKLLIPLAFASSLGGVITLIGTPPNLIVSNVLVENGYEAMSFFQFAPIGLVALFSGILFMILIGRKILPNNSEVELTTTDSFSANKLAGIYKIYHSLHIVEISDHSPIIAKSLADLALTNKYGITVVSIDRKTNGNLILQNRTHITPKARTVFMPGDLVLLFGKKTEVEQFVALYELKLLKNQSETEARKHLLTDKFGITEALVTPHSRFSNKTIRELHFRKKYGCTVLAIYRNGKYIQTNAGKERLKAGDALLIHGEWKRIELLNEILANHLVIVGSVSKAATTAKAAGKSSIAAAIMLFMLLLMTLEIIDPVIVVLLSAFLMIITGCVRSTGDAYQKINWESVILFAAMLPMATALENTGGVKFISDSVIQVLGGIGPYAVLAGFYLLTTTISQFISNTATAVIFAPIAITAAMDLGVSPYPFVIAVSVAASMAFATPVASPTNALVLNAGGYTFKDFVKVGVPLQLFLAVILIFFIPIFYPF